MKKQSDKQIIKDLKQQVEYQDGVYKNIAERVNKIAQDTGYNLKQNLDYIEKMINEINSENEKLKLRFEMMQGYTRVDADTNSKLWYLMRVVLDDKNLEKPINPLTMDDRPPFNKDVF